MIRRLSFDPANTEHQLFYELGHVLLVTDSEKRSRTEEDQLVDLQADWEEKGKKNGEEKVIGNHNFIAYRFTIEEDADPFDIYIADSTYDLFKKIVAEAPVMGHVRKFRRPLVAFVEGAAKGKLVEGVFTPTDKPLKKEDKAERALSTVGRAAKRRSGVAPEASAE